MQNPAERQASASRVEVFMGFAAGDFPEAERFYSEVITLPMYPALTREQQDEVIAVLGRVLQ